MSIFLMLLNSVVQLLNDNTLFDFCQHLFYFFSNIFNVWNGEGGIWTLAPLLTTYSLSRGAPSASLGTSPNCPTILSALVSTYLSFESFVIISHCFCFVKHFFQVFLFYFFCLASGESGIRTHAPLRTNGFQDRLVMTTSISLRIYFCAVCQRKKYSIIKFSLCQYRIWVF